MKRSPAASCGCAMVVSSASAFPTTSTGLVGDIEAGLGHVSVRFGSCVETAGTRMPGRTTGSANSCIVRRSPIKRRFQSFGRSVRENAKLHKWRWFARSLRTGAGTWAIAMPPSVNSVAGHSLRDPIPPIRRSRLRHLGISVRGGPRTESKAMMLA